MTTAAIAVATRRGIAFMVATTAIVVLAGCEKDAAVNAQGGSPTVSTSTTATSSTPTAAPPAGAAKPYDCKAILSNAEAKDATGLNFTLVESKNPPSNPFDGFTDCGYFAGDGTYMQASVWTGESYQDGFLPLAQAGRAAGAVAVAGVGDEAGWSQTSTSLGVRVGSTGITIAFELFGGPGPADMKGSAIKLAMTVISHL